MALTERYTKRASNSSKLPLLTEGNDSQLTPQKLPPLQGSLFTSSTGKGVKQVKVCVHRHSQSLLNPLKTRTLHNASTMSLSNRGQPGHQSQKDLAIISEFKRSNNPFEQGYTRADKMKYVGRYEQEPHQRLFEFSTISSLNQANAMGMRSTSMKVQGVENLRKKFQSNKLMQQIVDEGEFIVQNKKLVENIESLWKMKLLSEKHVHTTQLARNQSVSYVYNDYHSRSTNPGYARNDLSGTFFTR